MEQFAPARTVLEIEYHDEIGVGLVRRRAEQRPWRRGGLIRSRWPALVVEGVQGPTLEFYTSVCHELRQRSLRLWRDTDAASDPEDTFVMAPCGLFPAPLSQQDVGTPHGQYGDARQVRLAKAGAKPGLGAPRRLGASQEHAALLQVHRPAHGKSAGGRPDAGPAAEPRGLPLAPRPGGAPDARRRCCMPRRNGQRQIGGGGGGC